MFQVSSRIIIPRDDIRMTFSRSSGPGGQHVNKVNTRVMLRWLVAASEGMPAAVCQRLRERYPRRINKLGELIVTSQRFRDQSRNVDDCLEKFRQLLLSVASPPRRRRPTRPTRASKERRLQNKRRRSEKKQRRRRPGGGDES
jgi:ribosome-associated protein